MSQVQLDIEMLYVSTFQLGNFLNSHCFKAITNITVHPKKKFPTFYFVVASYSVFNDPQENQNQLSHMFQQFSFKRFLS